MNGENGAPSVALAAAVESPTTIAAMLQTAIERGASVEALDKLVGLHERIAAHRAASEFAAALAAFQAECPPIPKTETATILSRKTGTSFAYTYAPLDQIARSIGPLLHQRGFSYGWDSSVASGILTCVCVLRHRNGHAERATFAAPVDSEAAMSAQQKHAAALTYARRQSLIQVLGLTTTEPDREESDVATITPDQVIRLEELMEGVALSKARLFKLLNVERFEDLPAPLFQVAVNAINAKRQKQA